jgi:hypothetical protein
MMNKRIPLAKAAILASAILLAFLAGVASDKAGDNAKAYQAELDGMKGTTPPNILMKLEKWEFQRMDAWMMDNPTTKDLSKHDWGKVRFSKQEVRDFLSQAGKYKFALYGKVVGTSSATMGSIDEMGLSYAKDATVELKILTVVRLVFLDDKLVNVRTWPKVEAERISGGNAWRVH